MGSLEETRAPLASTCRWTLGRLRPPPSPPTPAATITPNPLPGEKVKGHGQATRLCRGKRGAGFSDITGARGRGALRCSICTGLSFRFPTFLQERGQPEAPGPSAHPDIATQQVAFLLQRFRTQGQGPPLSTSQEVWDRRWHVYEVVQRGSEKRRWGHGKSVGSFRGGLGGEGRDRRPTVL